MKANPGSMMDVLLAELVKNTLHMERLPGVGGSTAPKRVLGETRFNSAQLRR
jgi:hypothetical protein